MGEEAKPRRGAGALQGGSGVLTRQGGPGLLWGLAWPLACVALMAAEVWPLRSVLCEQGPASAFHSVFEVS